MSIEDKIIKARVQMISKLPFYGSLCMHLSFKEEKNPLIVPTMGVSPYGTVYYHPAFIKALSLEELKGVICHEVMHICLLHLERMGTRDRIKANIAMDYAVNLLIEKDFKLPQGLLLDHKWENMSWEQIYDKLPKPKLCDGDCSKCPIAQGKQIPSSYGEKACKKFGSFDKHMTKDQMEKASGANNGDGASDEQLAKDGLPKGIKDEKPQDAPNWRKIMQDAWTYAKSIGNMPAGLERLIDEFVEPQLSWRELLTQYITRSIPSDFTYRRPSRKSIVSGYYFPSTEKEEVEVVVCVDTSGSIGKEELQDFLSETLGLLQAFQRVNITLFSCDTMMYDVNKISTGYELTAAKIKGGGGTDFREPFKWIKKEKKEARVMVYFTDCYGVFPQEEDVPYQLTTIWVVSKRGDINAVPEYFPYKLQLK